MRLRTLLLGGFSSVLVAVGLALGPVAAAQAGIPPMTRSEIVARAESALGCMYSWGSESWLPNTGSGVGTDCSGLGLKCWEVPRTMLYQEEDGLNATISPRYTSYEFFNCLGPWTRLSSRSLLREGDIMVKNDGSSGHVVIYASGDAWNSPIVYEAPGTGRAIRRANRYLDDAFQPRRRDSILESTSIILDNPTAKSVGGSDLGANWTRSVSNPGFYGDNYQTQGSTSATAWARWTPRFPVSGYYDVYLRWTSGTNRATNARVHINAASGQTIRYIDQQANGGSWYLLGRYRFNAGYSTGTGSVTLWATGASGFVVADAIRFVPAQ